MSFNAMFTTTIRLRFDGRSTAIQPFYDHYGIRRTRDSEMQER